MSYADIDPIVSAWTDRNSFHLFTEFASRQARFFYTSSSGGECFQISVGVPDRGKLKISAQSIETLDDAELLHTWTVKCADLELALDRALVTVRRWMRR